MTQGNGFECKLRHVTIEQHFVTLGGRSHYQVRDCHHLAISGYLLPGARSRWMGAQRLPRLPPLLPQEIDDGPYTPPVSGALA